MEPNNKVTKQLICSLKRHTTTARGAAAKSGDCAWPALALRTATTASPDIKAPAGAEMNSEMQTSITMSGLLFHLDTALAHLIFSYGALCLCICAVRLRFTLSNEYKGMGIALPFSLFPVCQSYNKKATGGLFLSKGASPNARCQLASRCHQIKVVPPKDKW